MSGLKGTAHFVLTPDSPEGKAAMHFATNANGESKEMNSDLYRGFLAGIRWERKRNSDQKE